jgi:hypothetical protein
MKIETYLKTILILLTGSIFLQNCGPDDEPADYCDKHWTLNQDYLENLLFDYENTDTLLYKRTINNVVADTLMFVKQNSYKDILLFSNNAGAGDPACGSSRREFTRERIGWDYSSQYDSIFFNVQVVADADNGSGQKLFNFKKDLTIIDLHFYQRDTSPYITSEFSYDVVYKNSMFNKNTFTPYGSDEYENRFQLQWVSYYNTDYGIIEISKTDRTEVWDLIP